MSATRLTAIAIAVAGLVDPAIQVSGASRARLAVVVQQPSSPAANGVRDRLIASLSASYDIASTVTSDAAAAVMIGDRYPEDPVPDALRVATVSIPVASTPAVRIVRVEAPQQVPPATVVHLDVEIEALGFTGRSTDVTVAIGGLEVGRASHRWTADRERWSASIDAVPVGEPPYVLRIRLKPDTTQTVADIVVDVRRAPFRVQFFEPRPSWATTFARRALEGDPRFDVASRGMTSRGIATRSGADVPLGDPRLDEFDVVIAGGLDRLSAADARSLERYMRERGGAVVLMPDQRIDAGPAHDLVFGAVPLFSRGVRLQPDLVERLLEQSATLAVTPTAPPLRASELLVFGALTPGADVIARIAGSAGSPVVVSMPRGDGRLVLSGAMDAWRFRAADDAAFDRFWRSTIAGLALAVPPPIAISVEPPLLRPGEQGDAIVRVRSRGVTSVSASMNGDRPIRLWPEPEAGVYRGRFVATSTAGRSTIDVRTSGGAAVVASRTLLVAPDVQRVRPDAAPSLALLASSHGGIDVTPDRVADLERFLRNAISAPPTPHVTHPMRSAWWIVPFAACLSMEWWLRRRRGLR